MKNTKLLILLTLITSAVAAQDSSKLSFTTAVGFLKPNSSLGRVLQSSVAFNSGVELSLAKRFYVQGTLDFNTLKYDQQVADEGSGYLFQNTNSSLLMVGANVGKNFRFSERWFVSAYIGGGYLSIGEPRVDVFAGSIVKQSVVRTGHIFGRTGTRLGFNSKSRLLHTLYADIDWWVSPAEVQNARVSGFGFFLGTRMPM
jgi:hypothetical protein